MHFESHASNFRVSDFLRTKSVRWRVGYLVMRTFMDLVAPLFVLGGTGWFVGNEGEEFKTNDSDVVVFLFEGLLFVILCKLDFEYELPFLGNQYGLRGGQIKRSFLGMSLEYLTEWRNGYIVFFFVYKLCYLIRLTSGGINGELMLGSAVFDYLLQYMLILVWWPVRTIYLKYFEV